MWRSGRYIGVLDNAFLMASAELDNDVNSSVKKNNGEDNLRFA